MIQETSLLAYEKIKASLSDRQRAVFNFVKDYGSVCNKDISDGLGWDINRVTGRVFELRAIRLLVFARKGICRTGETVNFWKVNDVYDVVWPVKNPDPSQVVHAPTCSTPTHYQKSLFQDERDY